MEHDATLLKLIDRGMVSVRKTADGDVVFGLPPPKIASSLFALECAWRREPLAAVIINRGRIGQ